MSALPAAIVPAGREATCPLIFRGVVNQVEQIAYFPSGWTLQQMLGDNAAHSLRVTVGGVEVPRTLWPHVRPRAGVRIHVEFWPQGGGGARKWILTVVAIVATIFSYGAATGAAWSLVGTSTAWAVGGALVAGLSLSLIAPPIPRLGDGSADPLDQMAALTGTQNGLNPYGVIPLVTGDVTFYPPHASQPYTEYVGSDQYLIIMLDLGKGDLDVSDMILMGTALDEWDDVEYEVTTEPTLYTQDIDEAAINATLNDLNDTATRSTQTACTSASINIVCPSGLFGRKASGGNVQGSILWTVAYRATGSEDAWTNVTAADGLQLDACSVLGSELKLIGSEAQTLVGGVRWQFPAAGQYDVQVTRGASSFAGAATGATSGDATWTVLRSITPQNPSTTGTTKLVARIKATDQLTGVVRALSVRAAQRIRRWDAVSESWLDPVATQNCGWIYHWLLTECPATTRHAADDEMDLVPIADWAADCDDQGLIYSAVIDASRVMDEVVKDCLACGLATYGTRNGTHGVVRDVPQTVTRQTYTPLNRTSLTWQRNFVDPPHALRCQFTNPEADNQVDERVVYWDGYDETNATNIQQFDLRVVRDPGACWKIARYHLATLWLRPNVYQQECGMDHLVNDRGDLIELSGPVIGWGAGWGRIRDIDGTRITLAQPMAVETGKAYAFRVRLATAYSGHATVTIDPADLIDERVDVAALVQPALDGTTQTIQLLDASGVPVTQDVAVSALHMTDWQGRWLLYPTPRTNLALYSEALNVAAYLKNFVSVAATSLTFAGRVPYWEVTNTGRNNPNIYITTGAHAAVGAPFTMTLALRAGISAHCLLNNYYNGGGSAGNATVEILSGPGVWSSGTAASPVITGLSATEDTLVKLSGTCPLDGSVPALYAKPGSQQAGESVLTTRWQIEAGLIATAYIPTTSAPVTMTDYAAAGAGTGEVTLGQMPATGAVPDWDGSYLAGDVTTSHVTLDDAIAGLEAGQIYTVGEVDKLTLPAIITGIEKGSNMVERSARLTCVDANPGVWTAAAGDPPPFVSAIDGRPWCAPPDPPVVHVYDAASAPDDAGIIRVGVSVDQQPSSGIHRIPLYCPSADAPVRRVGAGGGVETIRVDQVGVGDVLEGADPETLAPLQHTVTHSAAERQPRVRLMTQSGHVLTCSSRAPIPVAGGKLVEARHAYGHRIAVRDADGRPHWSRVLHLQGFGPGPVQHIALSDGCFWAGGILHHNKPPRPGMRDLSP